MAMKWARAIGIGLLSLLAIIQVVRQAFVAAYASSDPARAARIWPSHPDVAFKLDMEAIARAAASGQTPQASIDRILAGAQFAPLAPEPFLVRGVGVRLSGDEAAAGQAFAEAKRRAPRSVAPRYFLADHYLRTNRSDAGLSELAMLTRLVPSAVNGAAPYYAAFAKGPGGAARVKKMLRLHPELEAPILQALAADPGNVRLILYLASERAEAAEPGGWQGRLIDGLVSAGQFDQARSVWARLSGPAASRAKPSALFDPRFEAKGVSPPFGWTLSSNSSALAEAQAGGRLHILYYGRDNATLASQLMLLSPGRYRLSFNLEGSPDASAVAWRVTCRPANRQLLTLPLRATGAGGAAQAMFEVPRDCPAQLLELYGTSPEFPETLDVTLSNLALSKATE